MEFSQFINQLSINPFFFIITILVLGSMFVSGWMDASNAISTCIGTRSLSAKRAIILAIICNFIGLFVMTMLSSAVAYTITNLASFNGGSAETCIALCAALLSVIIWTVISWIFAIPSSSSHALIAGISGSAIALSNSFSGLNGSEWLKVIYGLILATIGGFICGYLLSKFMVLCCKNMSRRKTSPFFQKASIFSSACMAFMQGAQDGQKFIGVLILGMCLSTNASTSASFSVPFWMIILCSLTMSLGTAIGGKKIIKSVGMDMVKLEKYQGVAADISSACCLFFFSLFGIPVSTTHTKTTSIMGVGAAKRLSSVNFKLVWHMVLTWILTFPGCGLIGFLLTKLLMFIF